MKVKVLDGNPVFATHVITSNFKDLYELVNEFQIEDDQIVCYGLEEKKHAERILKINGIEYNIEALSVEKTKKDKCKGLKYNNRSEVIDHVQNGKKPKLTVEELESKIEKLEQQISLLLGTQK